MYAALLLQPTDLLQQHRCNVSSRDPETRCGVGGPARWCAGAEVVVLVMDLAVIVGVMVRMYLFWVYGGPVP